MVVFFCLCLAAMFAVGCFGFGLLLGADTPYAVKHALCLAAGLILGIIMAIAMPYATSHLTLPAPVLVAIVVLIAFGGIYGGEKLMSADCDDED